MKKSELIFSALLVPVDFLMFLLAGIAAYFLRTSSWVAEIRPVLFTLNLPFQRYFFLLIGVAVFGLLVFAISGLYNITPQKRLFKEFFQIIVAVSATLLSIILYIFLTGTLFESRFIILMAWVFAIIFIFLGRFLVKKIQRYLVGRYDLGIHLVAVIGKDKMTKKVIKEINNHPDLGYRIVKHFPELNIEKIKNFLKKTTPPIDEVILASPHYERSEVLEILDFCDEQRIGFKFVPNLFQTLTTNIELDTFDGAPLIEIKRTPLDGWGKIIKRVIDLVGSLIGIIIFSPVMAVIALAIKLDSPGPVIYKNERVGPKRNFDTYKFRSMKLEYCVGRHYPYSQKASIYEDELAVKQSLRKGPVFKVANDPRRTKVGRFIEKTSLDELPQFFNVLKGEMSLVGPRPHMPKEVARYKKYHKKVLNIKPGITGLAQISGRSDLDFDEEVKLDTYYIENWSLKRDIYILLKTPLVVLFRRHKQ